VRHEHRGVTDEVRAGGPSLAARLMSGYTGSSVVRPTMHTDDGRGRSFAEPPRPDDTDARDDDARRAPVSSTSLRDLLLRGRRPARDAWPIGRRALVLALVLLAAVACDRPVAQPDEEAPDDRLIVGDGDPETLGELEAIAEQIAELRGLDFIEPVHLDVVTEEELVEVYRELRDEQAEDPEHVELRDERQRALETLHMLPEGVDLDEAIEAMVQVAVLGLFSPRTERAYAVSSDGELEPAVTATVAHELLHALQHQHVDLNRMEDIDEPDERFAFSSLVEGDALTIEEAWVEAHLDDEAQEERDRTLGRIGMDAQEVLSDIPLYVLVKQGLPYEIGEPFVSHLVEEGGQQAVDDALEEPPRTSVEIYDPQLYLDGFEPRTAPPLALPGDGWEEFHATTFGAWQVDFFSFTLGPGHAPIGSQWRGGALRAWTDPDDRVAAAFSVTFAGDAADTFCDRLPIWYQAHAGASAEQDGVLQTQRNVVVVDCDGQDVRLAAAPDVSLANAVLDLE
jgi:hypothetical protein